MSFRSNAYATVWSVEPKSAAVTTVRISTSKKDKITNTYETDFSGFVGFCGSACASKAASLKEKDRIKLKDVAVTNKFDKTSGKTYTNFNCYDFEMADGNNSGSSNTSNMSPDLASENFMQVEGDEEGLPY